MPGQQWTSKEERLYLDLLKEGKRTGRMGERFKAEFFKECVERMKPDFPHVSMERLNSKRAGWKSKWDLFLKLFQKTGYTYDEETGYFSAEPENWEELASGPLKDCCWFRQHPMPYKSDLEEIFSKLMATGNLARGRLIARKEEVVSIKPSEPSESQVREEEGLLAAMEDGRLLIPEKLVFKRKSEELVEASLNSAPSKRSK